jgi:hypothetical protein
MMTHFRRVAAPSLGPEFSFMLKPSPLGTDPKQDGYGIQKDDNTASDRFRYDDLCGRHGF